MGSINERARKDIEDITMTEPNPELTVVAGSEHVLVSGRAALLIYSLAVNANDVNSDSVGKLVASFAEGQTKLELRRSLPSVRMRTGARKRST